MTLNARMDTLASFTENLFPGATMKWAKNRQEQIKQERKDSGES